MIAGLAPPGVEAAKLQAASIVEATKSGVSSGAARGTMAPGDSAEAANK